MRSLDEILNRDNAPDALDKIERFANKVEITLAVLGHLRLLGKEMHGFAKSGGDGFAVLDMLAKRFAKTQNRVELAAILPVVGSHVHAQKRRVVLLLQGLDAGFRDFQLVHQSDGNATRRRAVFLVLAGRFGLGHGFEGAGVGLSLQDG